MKRAAVIALIAVMLALCCSCGLARDAAELLKAGVQKAAGGEMPEQFQVLPPLPTQPESEMIPAEEGLAEEFSLLADPEGLLAGGKAPTLSDIEQNGLYAYQADTGRYAKDSPFMGKDGSVALGFDLSGKNNYIDYQYSGSRKTLNARQIVKEYDYLYSLAREKYGKATIHSWLINPMGAGDQFKVMGEFDEEEITDAVNERSVAKFYYAWSRPGNSAVYVYLFLNGDDCYEIGMTNDRSKQFVPSPDAFVHTQGSY